MKPRQREPKIKRLHSLPLGRLFPNMVTLMALCAGLTSVRFALLGKWELSVTFIVIAAFLDGMDGRLARLLNSTSNFGAQLDSLTDFFNFGVAPALIMYLWKIGSLPVHGLAWAVVLFFAICAALRLARFNSELDEDKPEWAEKFFVGIPSPAAAGLALVPMMLEFQFPGAQWLQPFLDPWILVGYMAFIAIMMPSRLPTFSVKTISIRREYVWMILLTAGMFFIGLIMEPWMTLPIMGALYLLSLPLSLVRFYQLQGPGE